MTIDIPPKIETFLEQHQAEKVSFINDFQILIKSVEEKIDKVNVPTFKAKNKWAKFALNHSSIDTDNINNSDLGKIIRDNHNEFVKGFNF